MPTEFSNQSAASDVGRVGRLDLHYARQGPRTILATSRCSSPWHLFPPMYLDSSGCAFTSLVNPSGGFVAGDQLSIHASLDEATHVVISSPSANRIYRSLGEEARHRVHLAVASGAVLEWFPEVTIPFADSRFAQTVDLRLAKGATALIWDSLASGRMARGERWVFSCLRNEIRITTASGDQLLERFEVSPDHGQAGLVTDFDYVASFFLVSDDADPAKWTPLREILAEILDSMGDEVLGAVTQPPVPGLAVKLVARSAQSLTTVQHALWDATRRDLLHLPAPRLRRY